MWVRWALLGSFHVGFLTRLVGCLGELDVQDSSVTWLVETIIAVTWIFSQEYWPEYPYSASLHAFGSSPQGDWFPREITPRRTMQRGPSVILKASSDLASEILKHHTNIFSWFRIQGATQEEDSRRRKHRRTGILERRIDMKTTFGSQPL